MATSRLNETDLLKAVVRRGTIFDEVPKDDNAQREQLRMVGKIWTALNKLIRSQCNKDRIIDSLYFGSFGKTQVVQNNPTAPRSYTYCPGPKPVFKLIENAENVATVDQSVSKFQTKLVFISFYSQPFSL